MPKVMIDATGMGMQGTHSHTGNSFFFALPR
ncbi:hypothetical protein SAMN05880556_10413 [Azospirillum sp. RU38E]|nr:hypothetical protein SAMN05880556_10413 [Azospirillum sp. RU38E]SNS52781.1 hypothetical protein SAMN05880591_10413 [Azospirillum sp. RU37A]